MKRKINKELPPGAVPASHRRKRKPLIWILLAVATAVLAAAAAVLILWLGSREEEPADPGTDTFIELAFAGDLNVTDKVIAAGKTEDGYDYSKVLQDVLPLLADADATVLNFEGNLCGPEYGTATSSAPQELMADLAAAGVDLIQAANSSTINNGLLGLKDTLNGIREAGMEPLGAWASLEEVNRTRGFTLMEIRGIKVAFVAFTKGMDSISLPEGQEALVNLLYTDYTSTYQDVDTEGITRILQSVADEAPDYTVALVHWGSEYNSQVSSSQERIAKLMKSQGVDAIIGTHSHYVQQIDYNEETGAFVAYSLGDFWGDAERTASSWSAVLKLRIAKNDVSGLTRLDGFEYSPIYNHREETEGGTVTRLLRIRENMADYEAKGLTAISEDVYNAMKSANTKAEKLFTPPPKDEE